MLILHHAHIYTLDPLHPQAEAVAVENGRIMAVGTNDEVLDAFGAHASLRHMEGAVLLPGLTDAHLHLENYARSLKYVDCETNTRAECLRRVAERARITPPGEWIFGHGWNQNLWEEGYGSRQDLDAAAPNHPVYLTAKSLHASWANTAALRHAGISAATPDPEGGSLPREADGMPTGILLENAVPLLESKLPPPDETAVAEMIRDAQTALWRMGLTGVHDYDRRSSFMALQMLEARDELRLRVVKSIPLEDMPHAVAIGLRSGFGSDWLRIGSVKLFADGALGPRTAAMLQPYEGETDYSGMLMLDAEEIYEVGIQAAQSGISLAIHAIGDRANHEVLNAYEQLRAYESQNHLPALRHRLEHVQVLHPNDLPRLARLGIIASMQPIHAASDMFIADRHWGDRAALSYTWNSVLQQGTALAFGSDAPVEIPNPFWGMAAAVTRRRADGDPSPAGWRPEQCISLEAALRAYTTGAAYAAGWENRMGMLRSGYFADMIALQTDPFTCDSMDLYRMSPFATMVAGDWVWEK